MKHLLGMAVAMAVLAVGATGASAFTVVTSDAAAQSQANLRLADPDDLAKTMANQQSSGGGQTVQMGRTQLRFGATPYGSGAGNSPFLTNPAASMVPSQGH